MKLCKLCRCYGDIDETGWVVSKVDKKEETKISIISHLANPLIWFLYTLGIVLRYLILPVPVPFLCWIFLDHPSTSNQIYIFEVWLQGNHKQSRYEFVYDSSFYRIDGIMCEFSGVVYRKMEYHGPIYQIFLTIDGDKYYIIIFPLFIHNCLLNSNNIGHHNQSAGSSSLSNIWINILQMNI